jgi:hypothetical protein
MSNRIYNLKDEVVKEIVTINEAMERVLYYLESDFVGTFRPWAAKMFKSYRRNIAAYGGLLHKEVKWEQEDYLSGADLPAKIPEESLVVWRAKGVDVDQLLSDLGPYEIIKTAQFKPASMKKVSNG